MTVLSPRTDYHQIAAHARWQIKQYLAFRAANWDAFDKWAGEQARRAKEELTELCNEMGAPYFWATLPSTVRQATLDNLVRNNRPPGWVPTKPAVLSGPAPDDTMPGREATMPALTVAPEGTYLTPRSAVQAGPRGRFGRWVDERLERAETWWQNKRAATDKRMGLDAPARPAGHDESGQ